MKKLIAIGSTAFVYFCVATVVAIVAAFAGLWFKGALDRGRAYRVLAALHGLDIVTMQEQLIAKQSEVNQEQPSYADRIQQLTCKSLDLDLREDAVFNSWFQMNDLRVELEVQTARFDELKSTYAAKLQQLADEEQANALQELQRTLEAIQPAQAKDQILKMLDDRADPNAMDDVVTVLKNMPIDKRKRIIGEFDQGNDADRLYEILKNIRKGEPTASQTRETQEKLNEFGGGI
jgi:hypothetical protein